MDSSEPPTLVKVMMAIDACDSHWTSISVHDSWLLSSYTSRPRSTSEQQQQYNTPEHTRVALMATATKHCTICASNVEKSTRLSPQDHERVHGDDERACGQCWEAWLSLQVEEKKPNGIECLFCKSLINEDDFVSLARDATVTRYVD